MSQTMRAYIHIYKPYIHTYKYLYTYTHTYVHQNKNKNHILKVKYTKHYIIDAQYIYIYSETL